MNSKFEVVVSDIASQVGVGAGSSDFSNFAQRRDKESKSKSKFIPPLKVPSSIHKVAINSLDIITNPTTEANNSDGGKIFTNQNIDSEDRGH